MASAPSVSHEEIEAKTIWLEKKTSHKKLVIFDLDETLVHCTEYGASADATIEIKLPVGGTVKASLHIRPYAAEVLAVASRYFEVAVFTASHKCYADEVLNCIDPAGTLIQHRMYRDQCVSTAGLFVKDLRILPNWSLADIVLVDNAGYSFANQIDNAIPITSFIDDKSDIELMKLAEYLPLLSTSDDVRTLNR
jgi:CTD small phosphatase-like protein 2